MVTIDAVLVAPTNDDQATTSGGTASHQSHDGAPRLRRCSALSSPEEAARLLLVAGRLPPMSTRYTPRGPEAEFQPGSPRRLLRNLLGLQRVRDVTLAESQPLHLPQI